METGVHQILQKRMAVFSYVVYDRKTLDCVVIDPSTEPDKILSVIDRSGYNLKAVINTHGHADHTCGNRFIIKKTGAPLYIHKDDGALAVKFLSKFFAKTIGGKSSPTPDFYVENHDIIKAGSLVLEVLHTPGHTPGGICLFIDGNLFTGDTLFVGDVGRTDLPGGSYEILKKSIKRQLYNLPGETIVWPGHKYSEDSSSTIEHEKKTNPYTQENI